MAGTFNEKWAAFESKYGITLSLETIENTMNKIKQLDNFLFEKQDTNPGRTRYYRGLMNLLYNHIENKTKMQEGKSYDLLDLNIIEFIRDYEDVMKQKHAESDEAENERKPYEGIKGGKLLEDVKEGLKQYDKTLSAIWAERIVNGKMKFEDMQTITEAENDNMLKNRETRYKTKQSLANVLVAKDAMTKVCRERGFFWKAFHLIQYFREKNYLQKLIDQVNTYRLVLGETTDGTMLQNISVVGSAYESIETFKNEQKQKQAEKEPEKETGKIKSVFNKIETILTDPAFGEDFTKEVMSKFSISEGHKDSAKMLFEAQFGGFVFKAQLKNFNKKFDKAISTGADAKQAMETVAKEVFKLSKISAGFLGFEEKEELIAAQVIADMVMQKLTAVAFEPEKFGEFAKGYALNHPAEFGKGEEELFAEAKAVYEFNANREKISVDEAEFSVEASKSAPVEEAPVLEAPNLNKN